MKLEALFPVHMTAHVAGKKKGILSVLVGGEVLAVVHAGLVVYDVVLSCTTNTPFTPAKHVLLNWFSLNENYKQRTEKLDFPLDSSTC